MVWISKISSILALNQVSLSSAFVLQILSYPCNTKRRCSTSQPQHHVLESVKSISPLIICGPSGVGKGTIISRFMDEGGSQHFGFAVSHTTRQPRPGEINGVDYNFVSDHIMRQAIANDEFLEYAEVHGNLYGTSYDSLQKVCQLQKNPLLDIDVSGVKLIKEKHKLTSEFHAKYVFVAPPSMDILSERLIGRGTETKESVKKRTRNAEAEMEYGMVKGNFDDVIVNGNLDQACRDFRDTVSQFYDLL